MSTLISPGLADSPQGPPPEYRPPAGIVDLATRTAGRPAVGAAGAYGAAVNDTAGLLAARPEVGGKFLFAGGEKLYVRGVTYGPFGPDGTPAEYRDRATVSRDFARVAAAGFNSVRVYSVPPTWLLDAAAEEDLRVLVGLPWEQHVAFLDESRRAADIARRVAAAVDACAGHPAILAYAIGNEIPAPVVRWYGH